MARITFFEASEYSNDIKHFAVELGANITFEEDSSEDALNLSAPTRQELFDFVCEWESICGGPSIDEEELMESIED